MSNQPGRTRILDYMLLTLALPVMVWMELNEASRDISLALTGGKYSGYGQLNRKRYREDEDEPSSDWLRPPDYSQKNFSAAVWRAKNLKYIEKRRGTGGFPELVLTKKGEAKILKSYPLLKLAGRRWQGWWLVVAFDIPEIEKVIRKSVRRLLTGIGFAQWQKSVYVSPHDISDDLAKLLRDHNLQDKVVPMIAKRILAGSDWNLPAASFILITWKPSINKLSGRFNLPRTPKPTPGSSSVTSLTGISKFSSMIRFCRQGWHRDRDTAENKLWKL